MKELYLEKIAILREVLKLTQNVGFKDDEEDADKYVELIEKREELFGKAKALDEKLADAAGTSDFKDMQEAKEYTKKLSVLARQIIEQDNYMKEKVLKIRDEAKADVRNINTAKSLNNLYGNPHTEPGATGRDWSQ